MTDIRTYLSEREERLKADLTALRERIAPLERELFEVRLAQKAVGHTSSEPFQAPLFQTNAETHIDADAAKVWKQYLEIKAQRAANPYYRLTIKELVLKALGEQFPSGATAQQILEFFGTAWGRDDIERTSLSPQLSRLKSEERIGREGNLWFSRVPAQSEKAATDQ